MTEEIQSAASSAAGLLDEDVLRVTPLVGRGSVNKVFVVEAARHKVVVRLSERAEASDEYAKEAWCMERAAAVGVPVPTVLGLGRSGRKAYIVQSYIDGDEGRDSPAPRADIWRELGRYARLVHTIDAPGFGLSLSEITGGDARKSWLRHVEYNIESLTEDDPLLELKVLTRRQSKVVRDLFSALKARDFAFGLNHGDLSLKNTVVDVCGTVYLLDWGSAEAAVVPHHDLIEMWKMSMTEGDPDGGEILAFLEGYGISSEEFGRMTPELEGLLLLRAFDKLRWALDWNVGELGGFVSHAREAVRRCLG